MLLRAQNPWSGDSTLTYHHCLLSVCTTPGKASPLEEPSPQSRLQAAHQQSRMSERRKNWCWLWSVTTSGRSNSFWFTGNQIWAEIGFYLSVICTTAAGLFLTGVYAGARPCSLLEAATVVRFYSFTVGTGEASRSDAGCSQAVGSWLPADQHGSAASFAVARN